jgi:purine-nucleoside phosphorylase
MRNGIEALTILSVSDNIVTGEAQTASDRESANINMMRLALAIA